MVETAVSDGGVGECAISKLLAEVIEIAENDVDLFGSVEVLGRDLTAVGCDGDPASAGDVARHPGGTDDLDGSGVAGFFDQLACCGLGWWFAVLDTTAGKFIEYQLRPGSELTSQNDLMVVG